VRGNPAARQAWAVEQVQAGGQGFARLGLTTHASFPARWHGPMYPWPQRPAGLVEDAFDELARRWKPILDVLMKMASISALNSIPARICTMA
jgi:hypothetical protein